MKQNVVRFVFLTMSLFLVPVSLAHADEVNEYYRLNTVSSPDGLSNQVGGVDFTPDGHLVACFHRGEVYRINPETEEWSLFAYGLQEPLGLHAVSNDEILVMQRGELTRLKDTNGNGRADLYRTVSDDWGLSGNYCEYGYGPAVRSDGKFYISLNTASNNGGVSDETRGEFNELGRPGRMFSCVPYRGCVLEIDPETGQTTLFASGFRSPDGINFDQRGRLLVTDNQGDWRGTSHLYSVEKGGFYGHVSSLIWREGWDRGNPLELPLEELHKLRTRPAIQFPHGNMANSPTKPLPITEKADFPFKGQLLVGEMNRPRIMRVMTETVDGRMQGAVVPFYDGAGLNGGNHRMSWGPDGRLWVGHTHLEWAGGEGIQSISWNGKTPMEVRNMTLTEKGFDLVFTHPVDPETARNPEHYSFKRFYYRYHRKYGSRQYDVTKVPVREIDVTDGGRRVSLTLEQLVPGHVYELRLNGVKSGSGKPVLHSYLAYTLNSLRDGSTIIPQEARKRAPRIKPSNGLLSPESNRIRLSRPKGVDLPEKAKIVYNVNGPPLSHSSNVYREPIRFRENATLKTALTHRGKLISTVRIQTVRFASEENQGSVTNLDVNSDRTYRLEPNGFKRGIAPFSDRDYRYTRVPDGLIGATHIAVPQEDVKNSNAPLMSFDVKGKAEVYVAWDTRAVGQEPEWLSNFEKLNLTIDDSSGTPGYRLYRTTVSGGRVTLGPAAGIPDAMYHVIVRSTE